MSSPSINSVQDFVAAIGRTRFEKELGHKPQVVSRAISDNLMPAHWFRGARDLGQKCGVEAPEHLFRWHHGRSNVGSQTANFKGSRKPRPSAGHQ